MGVVLRIQIFTYLLNVGFAKRHARLFFGLLLTMSWMNLIASRTPPSQKKLLSKHHYWLLHYNPLFGVVAMIGKRNLIRRDCSISTITKSSFDDSRPDCTRQIR